MSVRSLTILSVILLLGACSTSQRLQQSTISETEPRTERPRRILYPKHVAQEDRVHMTGWEAAPEGQRREPNPVKYPTITFTEAESEHVRLPGINPLPVGGLTLLLEQMKAEFCYPYRGALISDYGYRGRAFHTGIDIKATPNDTIRAAFPGVVRMSKNYSGYGNIVVIRHYAGFETVYAHCSRNLVKPNDVVEAGTPIGLAGRTGRATTEHLHFELRAAGEHFDPKKMLDPQQMKLREGTLYIQQRNGKYLAYNSIDGPNPESDQVTGGADAPTGMLVTTEPASSTVSQPATTEPTAKTPATVAAKPVYYQVKKGDTLYAIARKYGTTVQKICSLNGISESKPLQINQRLRVK